MEKFKISDIQEIFVSDVERFHSLTQQYVSQLLNDEVVSQEALDDALRQCHTLKGLAATVEAWGLSCLGADLEKLLELAGSWVQHEREKANGVFEFILDHMQDWYVMNQFTCMEMLPQAWDVYQGLRGIMEERWPGYLPLSGGAAAAESWDAQYVRLSELEISEMQTGGAVATGEPVAEGAVAELSENLDVQGAQVRAARADEQSGHVNPDAPLSEGQTRNVAGAPLPVRVVPPSLRRRDSLESKVSGLDSGLKVQGDASLTSKADANVAKNLEAKSSGLSAQVDQPATPKPLQVVPPTLHRRGDASPVVQAAPPNLTVGAAQAEIVTPVVPEPVASTAQTELPPTAVVPSVATIVTAEAAALPMAETVTPPILRVTPPALKRRGKKAELSSTVQSMEAAAAPLVSALPAEVVAQPLGSESSSVTPESEELAAVAAVNAESIFAALPEAAEEIAEGRKQKAENLDEFLLSTFAVSAEGAQTSGDVSDLLELLSQEVAGYLAELTGGLTVLAGNLALAEPWELTRRLFHTIKGTAATFGLDAVAGPAKAAEARCIVAMEDASGRTREAFESCVHRAGVVARALHLGFDEGRLREALRVAEANAANVAAVAASVAGPASTLDAEMAGFFINDTRDQIVVIEQAVLRWEKLGSWERGASSSELQAPSSKLQALECVQAAQRGFHTIKGAGNSIGLTGVALSVHEVESFLEELAGAMEVNAEKLKGSNVEKISAFQDVSVSAFHLKPVFTFLLGALDQLRGYLAELTRAAHDAASCPPWRHDWSVTLGLVRAALAHGAEGVAGAAPANVVQAALAVAGSAEEAHDAGAGLAGGDEASYLRVETSRLYQLMNLIGEMVIDRARLARKIEQLAGLHRALAERHGALTGSVLGFQEQFEFNLLQREQGQKLEARSGELQASSSQLPVAHSQLPAPSSEFSELEFDRYDQFNVLARSLVEISHDIEQLNGEVSACLESFAAENVQFTQSSRELQGQVTGLGLVPVNTLFPRLQRAFRDACDVEGKVAELVVSGGEVLLDKVVVDRVYAPLLHLLRNAVAHGIEDGPTRVKRKKSARGVVRLGAVQLSNQIVLTLADDGGGVDAGAVRERAIAKGWWGKDGPGLSADQVVEFICRPGFSTASKVTSVSGRGIGLDVVRKEVEGLNGSVELKYVAGQGSVWTLRVPLTLSISEAILAVVGERQFAFPLNFVEAGLILEEASSVSESGQELYPVERRASGSEEKLEVNGKPAESATGEVAEVKFDLLPVLRLSRVLGIAGEEKSTKGLVVGVGDRRAIVVVDVVLRRQEVVVKQLDVVMAGHPLLNGASLDAEGRVIPILNLPALLKLGERMEQKLEVRSEHLGAGSSNSKLLAASSTVLRVLVVDDSLSVRKVQERYLRDLGCAVTVASDGLVALEKLRELDFDLIFTDLEMPRLNGYELISEVRGNPAWSHLPVVVISSRGADKYITKAMNLGASTFLSKPFTQEQLGQVLGHYAKGQE